MTEFKRQIASARPARQMQQTAKIKCGDRLRAARHKSIELAIGHMGGDLVIFDAECPAETATAFLLRRFSQL